MPAHIRKALLNAAQRTLDSDNPDAVSAAQTAIDLHGTDAVKSTLVAKKPAKSKSIGENRTRAIRREKRITALRKWVITQQAFTADDVEAWMHSKGYNQKRASTLRDMSVHVDNGTVKRVRLKQGRTGYEVFLNSPTGK